MVTRRTSRLTIEPGRDEAGDVEAIINYAGDKDAESRQAYLVADIGRWTTTATLFDLVEGRYRFIAGGSSLTTIGPPWHDVDKGLRQAINQITQSTGRRLMNTQGDLLQPVRSDGSGTDRFCVIVSAADPLEVILAGLLEDISLSSARRALQTIYHRERDSLSLEDIRDKKTQASAIFGAHPDVILLAGGIDGGADRQMMGMLSTLSIGLSLLEEGSRPHVIYAGNSHLKSGVNKALGDLTTVSFVDNVRPALDREYLDQAIVELADLYLRRKVYGLRGMDAVARWSQYPLRPTAHVVGGICEYFAAQHNGRVVCLDIDSHSITYIDARPGKVELNVRSDLGLGEPITNLLRYVNVAEIQTWLASLLPEATIIDYIYNRSLVPQAVSLSDVEHDIEQAIIRQMVRSVVKDAAKNWQRTEESQKEPLSRLILRGNAITGTDRQGSLLLAMLDALQPTGIFSVALDRYGILPAMGFLAPYNPQCVVQVLSGGALEKLGLVIVPDGQGQDGQIALHVKLDTHDIESLQVDVSYGTIEVIPLSGEQEAELTVEPAPGFDIGFGKGAGKKLRVKGGSVGLVVDARGRPVRLPADSDDRRSQLRQWLSEVGG